MLHLQANQVIDQIEISMIDRPSPLTMMKHDLWLRERLKEEVRDLKPIIVPIDIADLLPLLQPTAIAINDAIGKEAQRARRVAGCEKYVGVDLLDPLTCLPPASIDLRVATSSALRCIKLLGAVAGACHTRGLTVKVIDRQLRVGHGEHFVRVRVGEQKHQARPGSGSLMISIDRVGTDRTVRDAQNLPLELQLKDVVLAIYRGIAETRTWQAYLEQHPANILRTFTN